MISKRTVLNGAIIAAILAIIAAIVIPNLT